MKRIFRERPLTDEEAAKYQVIRDQVAEELPDLIARHHERGGGTGKPGSNGEGESIADP